MMSTLEQIVRRLSSYPWYEVVVEMLLIWICVFAALRFLRGTRGAGVVKGLAFIVIVLTLLIRVFGGSADAFTRLDFIYERLLGLLAIILIVVFQPELRRAMVRLGETRFFRPSRRAMLPVVDAVAEAARFLSKNQFGALIAIERNVRLSGLAQSGVELNALISARLLQSIFWPNNPLHDLGVVVSGDRILAAGVQFPLIEDEHVAPELGSRHRAGMGVSAETDAIVVIVSEETGRISIAERGRLDRDLPRDELESILLHRLRAPAPAADDGESDADGDASDDGTVRGSAAAGSVSGGAFEGGPDDRATEAA